MSCMFNRYHQFVTSLRSSLLSEEAQFLEGTGKDSNYLTDCYSKFQTITDNDVSKFDSILCALYSKSEGNDRCRHLAEGYKNLANTTEEADDFIKAAFWFRILYVSGEHSSYLDDYQDMILKGQKRLSK